MDKYRRYQFLKQHLEVGQRACLHGARQRRLAEWRLAVLGGMEALAQNAAVGAACRLCAVPASRSALTHRPRSAPHPTDPLVLHHQQLRDGAAADGLPGHHPHACAEERLCQVLTRRRGATEGGSGGCAKRITCVGGGQQREAASSGKQRYQSSLHYRVGCLSATAVVSSWQCPGSTLSPPWWPTCVTGS